MSGVSSATSRNGSEQPSEVEPHTNAAPTSSKASATQSYAGASSLMCSESAGVTPAIAQLVRNNTAASERVTAFLASQSASDERSAAPPSGNSSWERSADGRATISYARAGTNLEGDIAFAEAAAAKGTVPNGTGTVEVFSVSAQVGAQNEVQLTAVRVEVGTAENHVGASALNAEAHTGIYNPDGSVGVNFGASANIVAAEAQLTSPPAATV